MNTLRPGELAGPDLFTVRPDGTRLRRLTFTGSSHSPRWSPFGHRILFVKFRGTGSDIWVMGAQGRNKHRLHLARPFSDLEADWAPGGHRIVFARNGDGVSRLSVYSFETRTATPIKMKTPDDAPFVGDPAWSPDGQRIVFSREGLDGSNSDLFTVRPNGTDLTRLTFTPRLLEHHPEWSPDGTRIVFNRGRGFEAPCRPLFTIKANGTQLTRLQAGCHTVGAVWSPDGTTLVAYRYDAVQSNLWTMLPDGSSAMLLRPGSSPDWQSTR